MNENNDNLNLIQKHGPYRIMKAKKRAKENEIIIPKEAKFHDVDQKTKDMFDGNTTVHLYI